MKYRPFRTDQKTGIRRIVLSMLSLLIITCTAEAKPDLFVSKITLSRGPGGIFVERVFVTVRNGCHDEAGVSHLKITFKDDGQPTSKAIYYVVGTTRALRGGESQTVTFNVLEKKIVFGRHLIADADIYKKVDEASEDNNLRTVFPDSVTAVSSPGLCSK